MSLEWAQEVKFPGKEAGEVGALCRRSAEALCNRGAPQMGSVLGQEHLTATLARGSHCTQPSGHTWLPWELLASARCSSGNLESAAFTFHFPSLPPTRSPKVKVNSSRTAEVGTDTLHRRVKNRLGLECDDTLDVIRRRTRPEPLSIQNRSFHDAGGLLAERTPLLRRSRSQEASAAAEGQDTGLSGGRRRVTHI